MTEFASYISIDPQVRFGKPCLKDTRIAVADVLQLLAQGAKHEEILTDFPALTEQHIQAAIEHAS